MYSTELGSRHVLYILYKAQHEVHVYIYMYVTDENSVGYKNVST